MRITKLTEFQKSIVETGGYSSVKDCLPVNRASKSAWATLKYTWGVTSVFPKCAIFEALGTLTTQKWVEFCFKTVTTAESLGMNVLVEGFQNRTAIKEPVVYLCNHMSMTETILLPPILLAISPFSYVAKASLAHLPGLEKAAEHLRMVPVSRKSPREDLMQVLKVGQERLASGDSFLIFPQGTRCEVFSHSKYSSIGAKLAEKAGCSIVPIVVDTRCQPTRKTGLFKNVFKDFGTVDTSLDIKVACGPVIPNAKSKIMHEAAFEWMANKIESWGMPVER